jgi:uncharacterized membrane protein
VTDNPSNLGNYVTADNHGEATNKTIYACRGELNFSAGQSASHLAFDAGRRDHAQNRAQHHSSDSRRVARRRQRAATCACTRRRDCGALLRLPADRASGVGRRLRREHNVHVRLTRRVGQHIVAGSPLAWAWTDSGSAPDPAGLPEAVAACVRIDFERTDEQDAACGLRQLVDIASKALSPAVNDPYTAVQAIDHLAIVLASLPARPLGSTVLVAGPSGSVAAPALEFSGFLDLTCAQIRRYGSSEPMVSRTLIEMLGAATNTLAVDTGCRRDAIAGQLRLILEAAEQQTAQLADLEWVRREGERLMRTLTSSPADGG